PCCASSTSKVLRYFPVAPFASSALLPSGAVTVMPSRRIGTWSGKNSWLDTAASKVTQTSPPVTTACDGMIHCLCAEAVMGSTAARASASARVFFIFGLRKGMRVVWPGSGLDRDVHRAKFGLSPRLARLRRSCRPVEGDLQQLPAADFAHGFDDHAVAPRRQAGQPRIAGVELQRVAAGGTGRAGDAVHRHLLRAPGLAPPLAQVGQPLGAVAFGGVLHHVPDRKI